MCIPLTRRLISIKYQTRVDLFALTSDYHKNLSCDFLTVQLHTWSKHLWGRFAKLGPRQVHGRELLLLWCRLCHINRPAYTPMLGPVCPKPAWVKCLTIQSPIAMHIVEYSAVYVLELAACTRTFHRRVIRYSLCNCRCTGASREYRFSHFLHAVWSCAKYHWWVAVIACPKLILSTENNVFIIIILSKQHYATNQSCCCQSQMNCLWV